MLSSIISTAPPIWADAADLFLTLHTEYPVDDQLSNELLYQGHARTRVARTTLGRVWKATDNGIENTIDIEMPEVQQVGGKTKYSHWSLGLSATGSSMIVLVGNVMPPRSIVPGVIPTFRPGRLFAELIHRGVN